MCLSKNFMFDLEHDREHAGPALTPHAMHTAQSTWMRLTAADLSGVRTTSELIERVEERYNLSHEQAISDVEFWALDKHS